MKPLDITLAGERVTLLPERALFWPRTQTLFVADAHVGKAATFRAHAIPIPGGTTTDDLVRLSNALARTGAQRLVLLGDLFHAKVGRAEQTFSAVLAWRTAHAQLDITLVRGNHDKGAGDPPPEWRIACVDAPCVALPFVLQHHPESHEAGYVLAGHIHPAAQLIGAGRQRLKLPCFWFGSQVGVLPAFGSFTGSVIVAPRAGDQVYVVADDEVIDVEPR
jgi:DNA ligase-associated metallophosphoesterase